MYSNKKILLFLMVVIGFVLIQDHSTHQADYNEKLNHEKPVSEKAEVQLVPENNPKMLEIIETLSDSDEVESRIEVIDAQLKAKNLIAKLNGKKANSSEQELASELIKERSLLVKRKVELSLEKLEKEYL